MVEKKPLTVKEICVQLKPEFTPIFLKKVNFHCADLWKNNKISRVSSPYQYSLDGSARVKSIWEQVWEILQYDALFYSEIFCALKKKKVHVKQSTLSNVLSRLRYKKLILSSRTQIGRGRQHSGYIWGADRELIQERFRNELPKDVSRLLHHTIIPLMSFSAVTGLSKQRSLRMMKRIAVELDEFVLQKKSLRRVVDKRLSEKSHFVRQCEAPAC